MGADEEFDGYRWAQRGDMWEASDIMQKMRQEGLTPDVHSYTSFINACCKAGDMQVFESIDLLLTPKGPMIHSFKMKNSIDRMVKNIILMGSNFISPELVKTISRVGKK